MEKILSLIVRAIGSALQFILEEEAPNGMGSVQAKPGPGLSQPNTPAL